MLAPLALTAVLSLSPLPHQGSEVTADPEGPASTAAVVREITKPVEAVKGAPVDALANDTSPATPPPATDPALLPAFDWPTWDRVAECESGGEWHHRGARYDGGLQIAHATWRAYGGREFAARPAEAAREEQIVVARRILADSGWRAWPACSRRLGLR